MRFSEVIGHAKLKKQLIDEINHDKVSHAQLFLGKAGHGTLPMALAFVQYLFCENKQENDSCGECPSCRKVERLQHPDLHFSFPTVQFITRISNGALIEWREQIQQEPYFNLNTWIKKLDVKERKPIISEAESQEIIKKLTLRSFEGGYKVMLIWMAEEMNATCSNKLLKLIEEPPDKTLMLLVAESHEMMLQTVLSRTQKVHVPRVNIDELSAFLRSERAQSSNSADSVSSRADGDVIEALQLLGNHFEHDENRDVFIQLMRVCYKKNVIEMIEWAESISGNSREYQKVFLKYALHMFRQSMLRNYTDDTLTNVSSEEARFLQKFSQFISGNNILDFIKTFDDGHYHIERNANPKILFTQLCFQVMRYIHHA